MVGSVVRSWRAGLAMTASAGRAGSGGDDGWRAEDDGGWCWRDRETTAAGGGGVRRRRRLAGQGLEATAAGSGGPDVNGDVGQ